ncbi:hypothetical protein B879_03437 [Cecembia lonarensis LW9]|uniref:Uncharacterized protein n=1 Tax=Cecembia lonarensis (strain CCUG 58316 / KCTC 22772 / LW9) TaxID=1225176 RepID=K1LC40_CECL9|nr:hypothetical protein B879_03437 [Cecembia lonarensis LW9]
MSKSLNYFEQFRIYLKELNQKFLLIIIFDGLLTIYLLGL